MSLPTEKKEEVHAVMRDGECEAREEVEGNEKNCRKHRLEREG